MEKNAYLEPSCQELVFDFQVIALPYVHLERFVDHCVGKVVLDVLPPAVTVSE